MHIILYDYIRYKTNVGDNSVRQGVASFTITVNDRLEHNQNETHICNYIVFLKK